jgi:TonB family protein
MKIIHKALGISILIHMAILVSLVVLTSLTARKVYIPMYQVSLVTQPEPPQKEAAVQPQKEKQPPKEPTKHEKKAVRPKKTPPKKEVEKKQVAPERSLRDVQETIDEMRKKMASKERVAENRAKSSRVAEARRNAYLDAIAAHIQANWSLLQNEMENVGSLTTDIGLQIRRDGTVTQILIEKSSGDALFDEFAVRAVKRSTPLPPFPTEVEEERIEVTIGLSS